MGVGLTYHGALALDIGFGLGPDAFVFVGRDHFWGGGYRAFVFGPERAGLFFAHSAIHNGYRLDHGRFVADGWGRERIAAFTHHEVAVRAAHEMRAADEHRNFETRRIPVQQHAGERGRVDEHGAPGRGGAEEDGHGPGENR